MQPKLAEAAGLGLLKIVEKPCRNVAASCVRSVKAALEKEGVRFIGKDGGGTGVRLLGRGSASGSGKSEFPCRGVAETPFGPTNRQDCILASGDDVVDSAQPPKQLTQFLTRLFRMSVAEMS
jgi:hypothetical protein